ncbi:MAG: hypothetical protein ABIV63_05235 [Caldimonas sp.]
MAAVSSAARSRAPAVSRASEFNENICFAAPLVCATFALWTDMTYTFESKVQGDVLLVRVGGERSDDGAYELRRFWRTVADQCRSTGIRKVLSITTSTGELSSMRVYAWFKQLASLGFDPFPRIAVVILEPRDRSVVELGIAVAAADGWTIRLFPNEREARDWLNVS